MSAYRDTIMRLIRQRMGDDMTVSRVEGPKSFPVDWTPKASDGAR
jgi:hypothetical protein